MSACPPGLSDFGSSSAARPRSRGASDAHASVCRSLLFPSWRRQFFILNVAGITDTCGFHYKSSNLSDPDRAVLDATRYDDELARLNLDSAAPELHTKTSTKPQKEFIGIVVAMPDKVASELNQLHLLRVHKSDNLGTPVLSDLCQFRRQINL
jgi:hypothetical protein